MRRAPKPYSTFLKALTLIAAACVAAACSVMHDAAPSSGTNVLAYGAVADGKTDCTEAFQSAMAAMAEAGGGSVFAPAGHYAIKGTLDIPGAVTLQGTHQFAPTDQREDRPALDGSVLIAYSGRGDVEAKPFITLAGSMAGLRGFMITYGEWTLDTVPPVPYPPTLYAGSTANNVVENCCFLNSYEAIRFNGAGRFLVRNVLGYPSWRGLYVDMCLDIGRIENVHFWPFGGFGVGRPLTNWINLNGTAFEFARYDWCYVLNTFCFGYGVGYKFSKSPRPDAAAGMTNGSLIGIGADACERAVLVEGTWGPGIQFVNAELVGRWGSPSAVPIEVAPGAEEAVISLSNSTFWGPIDKCIWLRSPGSRLVASNCTFKNWDVMGRNSAAIEIDAGKAIVQGSQFLAPGVNVRVGKEAQSAILMGNQATDGFQVDNHAGDRTQLVANEADHVRWTDEARLHYRVDIGSPGDARYLSKWSHLEPAVEEAWGSEPRGTKRWSTSRDSELRLPVAPGKAYEVAIDVLLHPFNRKQEKGIFLDGAKIADLPDGEGSEVVRVVIPPQEGDLLVLNVRTETWKPSDVIEGSNDSRTLGVAVRSATVRAQGAPDRVFQANTGRWMGD